ncbi:hypothetical protein BGP82_00370 [Pseudomonas putida]|uniref:Uncharacterized protein n=1 Tax=Pseudomonas putida TaxID=303 RepID=A0A2S3XBG6_PSEPU|nr:hypothetical protein [Pseudomonas putida]POG12954.1 hypothetical protein BGP82_00370 [Pseudomonas putida]
MKTREELTNDYRINDLQRVLPNSDRAFREIVLKQMGDVDSLGYAKEFIRLKQREELLKAYAEANPTTQDAPEERDVDITVRMLQEKYDKK